MDAFLLLLRRRVRDENGISVIELMVAVTAGMVVFAAVLDGLDALAGAVPRERERAHAISEAQVGVERMVRELRQTYQVVSRTAGTMHVRVYSGEQVREVVYSCQEPHPTRAGLYRCMRWQVSGGAPGPKHLVVDRVLNKPSDAGDEPFQWDPADPRSVRVRLRVPAAGERTKGYAHKVTLDGGFYMRNCSAGC